MNIDMNTIYEYNIYNNMNEYIYNIHYIYISL